MSYHAIRKQGGNLDAYLLSERRQSVKLIYCMIPTVSHFEKTKSMQTIKIPVVAEGKRVNRLSIEGF